MRARAATARDMSISAESWKCGAVAFDSAIRRATVCWSFVSSSWVTAPLAVSGRSRAPAVGAAGVAAGAATWAAAGAGLAAIARSTSALTMRPPGPEPESAARSSPFSLAIRRASGEAFTRPSPLGAGWAGASAAGASTAAWVGAAFAASSAVSSGAGVASAWRSVPAPSPEGFSPASPTRAITSPIGNVSPSSARVSTRVPAAGAS